MATTQMESMRKTMQHISPPFFWASEACAGGRGLTARAAEHRSALLGQQAGGAGQDQTGRRVG